MTDEELIHCYAVGIYMLTLLDEWERIERIGIVAKIYNTISKKHSVFHKQHIEVSRGKKKKYSKKCELFIRASAYSTIAWKKTIRETTGATVLANTIIHNLYMRNANLIERIYGLKEEDFRKLDNSYHKKREYVTLPSCKIARVLNEETQKIIQSNIESEDIYKILYKNK